MSAHLPRHQLEELAGQENPELRAHVDACAHCSERLRELLDARASFMRGRDPQAFARRVVASRSVSRRPARWFAPAAAVLAVAAAVLLIRVPNEPGIRYKGGQSFQVFVQRRGSPEILENGQALDAGDQLAFAYSLPEARHLLLLSIDDTGTITKYYPVDGHESLLGPATRASLSVGIELDEHRGEERLVALFSREPIDETGAKNELRAALRRAEARGQGVASMGPLALPAEQASVWFRKP